MGLAGATVSGKYKTTPADFKRFQAEAARWIAFFGLIDYQVTYRHQDTGGMAQCRFNQEDRSSEIILSTTWWRHPDPLEMERVAFHEVCELMLFRLSNAGEDFYKGSLVQERAHEVVRRLENTIFPHRARLLNLKRKG